MGTTFAIMTTKKWTGPEVEELARLAARKGYKKGVLAKFIGIAPATLSIWIAGNRGKEISLVSRNALSYVESRLKELPSVPK